MACSVGTSLKSNCKTSNDEWAVYLRDKLLTQNELAIEGHLMEKFIDEAVVLWFDTQPKREKTLENERLPTAELQSIVRWLLGSGFHGTLELYLLPSEAFDSRATAYMAHCFLIEAQERGFLPEDVRIDSKNIEPLPIEVSDEEKFNKSIGALFAKYDDLRKNSGQSEFVINSTGGYKAICAFSSIYAQLHGLRCIYTFETDNNTAIELPPLPIGYTLESLDDEISILKGLKEQNQLQNIDRDSSPSWLQNLLRDGKLSPLADMLLEYYEEHRHTSEAIGLGMLEQIDDAGIRDYLKELIRGPWSQLWLGDQIPETVEHSRRHSKRLMELAGNLYRCAKKELDDIGMWKNDEAKALLIASIYLHDIGHTVIVHPLTPKNNDSEGVFPLGDFPSCVREVHHLLSAEAIRERREDLFSSQFGEDNEKIRAIQDMLKMLVPYVAEHHRGYTTLACEQGQSKGKGIVNLVGKLLYGKEFCDTLRPLERRLKDDEKLELEKWKLTYNDVIVVSALLRVLDGCDVQSDRTGSDEYVKARFERTKMEAKAIWRALRPFLAAMDFNEISRKIRTLTENIHDAVEKSDFENLGELCKNVYEEVINSLIALKDSGETCELTPDNHRDMITLSMINRYVFKWEQFLHFDKHRSVNFVLPLRIENDIVLRVFPNTDARTQNADADVDGVVEDIRDEIAKTGEVLKRLNIKAEKVSAR
jgi:hypothetical protein